MTLRLLRKREHWFPQRMIRRFLSARVMAGFAVAVIALTAWLTVKATSGPSNQNPTATAELNNAAPDGAPFIHATTIRKPNGAPLIKIGVLDEHGREATVACSVCHTTKPANVEAKLGSALTLFHQGLNGKHGNLSCVACHNPSDGYASLRLADGKSVLYTDVMTLCAQCHGPQFRDYQHGAHGGMTGHWDLTKGDRVRNNCIDCHDVHHPKYPTVVPARGPNDRFLTGSKHE